MKKRIVLLGLIMSLALTSMPSYAAKDIVEKNIYWPKGPKVTSSSAIIMEANTGAILYEKKIHDKHYPASITKILTSLIAVENGNMEDTVTFSHDAVFKTEGTTIARDEGEKMSLEDTIYAVMLGSANECAYATAEHIGGSIKGFVKMMNDRAKEIGCKDSTFCNPHGLPDKKHKTSAYDMAIISREALKNENFRKITGTKTYTIPPTNKHKEETYLVNHHAMLTYYHTGRYIYDGCIGGKTGYTQAAGNTLVTYAEKNGMTLICVVMKTTSDGQYEDTTKLLDYCFDNYQTFKVSEHDRTYSMDSISKALNFQSVKPYLMVDPDAYVVLPKTAEFSDTTSEVKMDKKSDEIAGSIDYYYGDKKVGEVNIEVTKEQIEAYKFNNADLENQKEDKNIIEINIKQVILIALLIILLVASIFGVIYLRRNIYVLMYDLKRKKRERRRGISFKGKKRIRRYKRRKD